MRASSAGVVLALLAAQPAVAWDDHALATAAALEVLPEVTTAPPAVVESLDAFLAAERARLGPLLEEEERWARERLPHVAPRPDALRFDPAAPDLRASFLAAIRVNPRMPLPPFLQALPGHADDGRPPLAWAAIATLATPPHPDRIRFQALRDGERVAPLAVIATAADEPDYGLDVGLFEDSGTPHGARYGFGKQPFGNPGLDFGTQAPFHMGFFHEPGLLYRLAPFLRRSLPELRVHQFSTLARFAFATGHPYWGYRFLGWGLHYVGDLTQPFHARPAPGVSLPAIVRDSVLDLAGFHGPKARQIQLLTNRHLALEAVGFAALWGELADGSAPSRPLVAALRDAGADASFGPWREGDPRALVTERAARKAAATDAALRRALPRRWTDDPAFRAGEAGFPMDPDAELGPAQRAEMIALLADLFRDLGVQTRRYARSVVPTGAAL